MLVNNSLYDAFVASDTTSIVLVLFNIIWFNFKFIIIVNNIAPIPSIEIITFVYLNNSDVKAINPIKDILASNPFPLYLIVAIINIITNITATPAIK